MLSPPTSPSMVGRASELAALLHAQATSLDGTPLGAVVIGEAGIGKTRLLEAFVDNLDPSYAVARGQCVAMGALVQPLAPLRSVLRDLVSTFGRDEVLAAAGPQGHLLSALAPELQDGPPAAISQEQLHDLVSVLLAELSDRTPIVLILEDLHWADIPMLDLLRSLMYTLRRGRVTVIVSFRTGDVGRSNPLRPFLVELDRSRNVIRIELGPLTQDEVLEQIRQITGSEPRGDEVAEIVKRSDGIPFFIEELLALGSNLRGGPLPETLRDLLLARYYRLEEPTQAVVRLIAAGGLRVEHSLVEQVYDGEHLAFEAAIREAVGAQILVAESTSYAFRHSLTQEAMHDELLPGERTRFHVRYATALEALPADRRRNSEAAHHWLAAQDLPRAFAALVAGSRDVGRSGAPLSAAQLGERALTLWPRVPDAEELAEASRSQLYLEVAENYDAAGDSRALDILEEALAEITEDVDRRGRALLLHESMVVWHNFGKSGGIALCQQALEIMPEGGSEEDRAVRTRVLCGLGVVQLFHQEPGARLMLESAAQAALNLMESATDPAIVERARFERVRALMNLSLALSEEGDLEGSLSGLGEALELGADSPAARLRHVSHLCGILVEAGRYQETIDRALSGFEYSKLEGMERSWGGAIAFIAAEAMVCLGELDRAERLLGQLRESRSRWLISTYLDGLQVELLSLRDEQDRAWKLNEELLTTSAEVRSDDRDDNLRFGRISAELKLRRGDLDSAWHEVAELWAYPRITPGIAYRLIVLGGETVGRARRTGRQLPGTTTDDAERRLRDALEQIAGWDVAEDWRTLLDAEFSGADGTGSDVAAWRTAVAAARRGRVPVRVAANAQCRLAEALLATGARTEAAQAIDEVRALAQRTGMRYYQRRADELATRAGLEPPDPAPGEIEELVALNGEPTLTARELQVLELVAEGLTNRQIGERLFISGKTASVHVSAILRKLGAASRTEAATIAARLQGT